MVGTVAPGKVGIRECPAAATLAATGTTGKHNTAGTTSDLPALHLALPLVYVQVVQHQGRIDAQQAVVHAGVHLQWAGQG